MAKMAQPNRFDYDFLEDAIAQHSRPWVHGRRINAALRSTSVAPHPPTIVVHGKVSRPLARAYHVNLENSFRKVLAGNRTQCRFEFRLREKNPVCP